MCAFNEIGVFYGFFHFWTVLASREGGVAKLLVNIIYDPVIGLLTAQQSIYTYKICYWPKTWIWHRDVARNILKPARHPWRHCTSWYVECNRMMFLLHNSTAGLTNIRPLVTWIITEILFVWYDGVLINSIPTPLCHICIHECDRRARPYVLCDPTVDWIWRALFYKLVCNAQRNYLSLVSGFFLLAESPYRRQNVKTWVSEYPISVCNVSWNKLHTQIRGSGKNTFSYLLWIAA